MDDGFKRNVSIVNTGLNLKVNIPNNVMNSIAPEFALKKTIDNIIPDFSLKKLAPRESINRSVPDDMIKTFEKLHRERIEKEARETAYAEEKLVLLRDISSSLKGLDDVVYLLSKSVNKQEETLELLTEIFSIGVSSDEETAHSRYQKVKSKINNAMSDVESAKKLVGLAKYIYIKSIEYF